MMRTF